MNKNGISLVALVITIIVLIILTGAVIMTGVNTPAGASEAVAGYNLSMVQDAVTLFILNDLSAEAAAGRTLPTTAVSVAKLITGTEWVNNAATLLNLSGVDLTKFVLSTDGVVSAGTATIAASL